MLSKLTAFLTTRRNGLSELAIWTVIYGAFTVPMAIGETNGIGYFQQPKGISLWAPLAFGGAVNVWIIYLQAFKAMPYLLRRGQRIRYLPTLATIIIAYIVAHLSYQLILARTLEPSLQTLSVMEWTIDNLKAFPVVYFLSVVYKFGRDWVVHITGHHELALRTHALESELRLVKEELAGIQTSTQENQLLRFESSRQKIQTPFRAIRYIKAAGNYIEIVTNDKTYTVYGTFKDILKRLPPDRFIRTHRSYIVNIDSISKIDGNTIDIADAQLPMSATCKPNVLKKWVQTE